MLAIYFLFLLKIVIFVLVKTCWWCLSATFCLICQLAMRLTHTCSRITTCKLALVRLVGNSGRVRRKQCYEPHLSLSFSTSAHVCAAIKTCEYKQQQSEQIVFWADSLLVERKLLLWYI